MGTDTTVSVPRPAPGAFTRRCSRRPAPSPHPSWNAYRYPTEAELAAGRAEHDMVWVGAADTRAEAMALLPANGTTGDIGGQVQQGIDGTVWPST